MPSTRPLCPKTPSSSNSLSGSSGRGCAPDDAAPILRFDMASFDFASLTPVLSLSKGSGRTILKCVPSVVSHKYAYEDVTAFWLSARRDDL